MSICAVTECATFSCCHLLLLQCHNLAEGLIPVLIQWFRATATPASVCSAVCDPIIDNKPKAQAQAPQQVGVQAGREPGEKVACKAVGVVYEHMCTVHAICVHAQGMRRSCNGGMCVQACNCVPSACLDVGIQCLSAPVLPQGTSDHVSDTTTQMLQCRFWVMT